MVVMLGDGSDSSGRFGALLDERRSLYSAVFANNPPSKWLKSTIVPHVPALHLEASLKLC